MNDWQIIAAAALVGVVLGAAAVWTLNRRGDEPVELSELRAQLDAVARVVNRGNN